MAAIGRATRTIVRAARVGEGALVAALWRELWDVHERWGGYPGSRDPRVYAELGARLDDDARVRAGHPTLGRHVHLVAEHNGVLCGQVEGWLDQHGTDASTPLSCDVRSLIVASRARGAGIGRELLSALAAATRTKQALSVLAAEVLEPNPAHVFYARVGYTPVSWSARMSAVATARTAGGLTARLAAPADALAIACLESTLADRRRAAGDARFDRPRAIDATTLAAIAAHLATDAATHDPATMVTVDSNGAVLGVASFTVHVLEPPFLPMRRALVGRFALDPASPVFPLFAPLVTLGCRMAAAQGAEHVEVTDLSGPGTDLYNAALASGAEPWSRVVTRFA
jgi:GNAT superfamily N-acetyltransferase